MPYLKYIYVKLHTTVFAHKANICWANSGTKFYMLSPNCIILHIKILKTNNSFADFILFIYVSNMTSKSVSEMKLFKYWPNF